MNVLGLNYYFHDSSACVMSDGRLVAAAEEERFVREKHTRRFPARAIDECLRLAGLDYGDIEHIAVGCSPLRDWGKRLRYAGLDPSRAREFVVGELRRLGTRQSGLAAWLFSNYASRRLPSVHFVPHHIAHVVGSYYVSPHESAALLALDGSGEWATSFLGVARGPAFECFQQSEFPMSLGSFYEAVTEFCGFMPNYDEGKTMGLAPYGDPRRFREVVRGLVSVDGDGRLGVDLSYFDYHSDGQRRCGPKFHDVFGAPRRRGEDFADRHRDAAAAFQEVLEERVLSLCGILKRRTAEKNLVIAGGVALNSVMNGRIVRESGFHDLYVMPGAGDNGTAIGAAAFVVHSTLGQPRHAVHDDPFLGGQHSPAAMKRALEAFSLPAVERPDVVGEVARRLHEGKIVGWFQGRTEFGPRSLGNRSILANPTLPEMKDQLNLRVKHRESFRPFAPSVTREKKAEHFETEVDDPFMLKVCYVRPSSRAKLPAITHVDGSARLQTVHRETNPRYHALLTRLEPLIGAPVVLNTSFNVMDQPIVETPREAIECFLATGIDTLALGDFVVDKNE